LADNGCMQPAGVSGSAGCVQTHALVTRSPAINASDNAVCTSEGITTDQRGEDRDNKCDIGAFEFIDGQACFVINGAGGKVVVFCL
jgi:hypothetical protein